jgi:hypothetical protein
MTDQEIRDYLSGKTPRIHAVDHNVVHGEIRLPLISDNPELGVVKHRGDR